MAERTARDFALLGAALVLLGLLTGLGGGLFANPRMGLSSHLAALMGGTLLLALSAGWHRVALSPRQDRAAFWLLAYGNVANWAATLLAAIWGGGDGMMPIAAAGRQAAQWQEHLIGLLLVSLSLAAIAGMGLAIKGLLAGAKAD